jgi:hypothetical protein
MIIFSGITESDFLSKKIHNKNNKRIPMDDKKAYKILQ